MRARELAEQFRLVSLSTNALDAARSMGEDRIPGIIVCDGERRPLAVLPGSQVLRFLIPRYVQDDPALARVYDEDHSDKLMTKLSDRTVEDLLPQVRDRQELPVVDPDATTVEVAAVMARMHSPVVVVVDEETGDNLGVITTSRLFEVLFTRSETHDTDPTAP